MSVESCCKSVELTTGPNEPRRLSLLAEKDLTEFLTSLSRASKTADPTAFRPMFEPNLDSLTCLPNKFTARSATETASSTALRSVVGPL